MNELSIPKDNNLYQRMRTAIAECHSIDDCKNIAEQASAIAAYYKQIKDDESVRKFLSVKLRAWRRIGEIFATIDVSDCETQTAQILKINGLYPQFNFSQVSQALALSRVPVDFFESAADDNKSIASLLAQYTQSKWEATPEGQRAVAERKRVQKEHDDDPENQRINELFESLNQAYEEVGFTMERHDRRKMRSVVLLIKEELHAVIRQAAFDHHLTMQAVLREALNGWLIAHGYEVPTEKRRLRRRRGDDDDGRALSPS